MNKHLRLILLLLPLLFCHCARQNALMIYPGIMPDELCYLDEIAPDIKTDLKYCGYDNFVGRPIDGYTEGRRAILRKDAAEALARAQQMLKPQGLGLLVWDAYRPHRALRDFYPTGRCDSLCSARFCPPLLGPHHAASSSFEA